MGPGRKICIVPYGTETISGLYIEFHWSMNCLLRNQHVLQSNHLDTLNKRETLNKPKLKNKLTATTS